MVSLFGGLTMANDLATDARQAGAILETDAEIAKIFPQEYAAYQDGSKTGAQAVAEMRRSKLVASAVVQM
jgi:hypothetical protein